MTLYENDSDNGDNRSFNSGNTDDKKIEIVREYYTHNQNSKDGMLVQNKTISSVINNTYDCSICYNKNGLKENYLILSCNHIFHIQCLAETYFQDIYKYPIIDSDYFSNCKCSICDSQLQLEELMYLHGKFLSNTKNLIGKHQTSIQHLEIQLKKIKNELRTCYDYKHKLEQEREKSKQIVTILSTMM